MSYSNDQTQIRAGLVNYIGALLSASKYDNDKAKKHSTVAILLEEVMNLCKDENGIYDMYSCKPIFRLTSGVIKQRINLLSGLPQTVEVREQIKSYQTVVEVLDKTIESTKL